MKLCSENVVCIRRMKAGRVYFTRTDLDGARGGNSFDPNQITVPLITSRILALSRLRVQKALQFWRSSKRIDVMLSNPPTTHSISRVLALTSQHRRCPYLLRRKSRLCVCMEHLLCWHQGHSSSSPNGRHKHVCKTTRI